MTDASMRQAVLEAAERLVREEIERIKTDARESVGAARRALIR